MTCCNAPNITLAHLLCPLQGFVRFYEVFFCPFSQGSMAGNLLGQALLYNMLKGWQNSQQVSK